MDRRSVCDGWFQIASGYRAECQGSARHWSDCYEFVEIVGEDGRLLVVETWKWDRNRTRLAVTRKQVRPRRVQAREPERKTGMRGGFPRPTLGRV